MLSSVAIQGPDVLGARASIWASVLPWLRENGVLDVTMQAIDLPDPSEDMVLIVAVAGGDASALAMLYDRYGATLLGVAERIIGIRREAEDLLHDFFIEVWQRAGDYDRGRGTVRTWLLVRLRSRAIDRRRSSRVSRTVSVDECPVLAAAVTEGDFSMDRSRIRDALSSLTAEQREVLLLGYFEGLSSSETAERIGVPIGTVKSRIAAARSRLRVLLGVTSEGWP